MEYIPRAIQPLLEKKLYKGKAVIVYGPRQVGKTTLVQAIAANQLGVTTYLNCDEPTLRVSLTDATSTQLKQVIGNARLVVIDEAQRVPNIGLTLKLLVDTFPQVQVIATGSSSFELSNRIKEPLTGRVYEFHLYPLAREELVQHTSLRDEQNLLEQRLIFGSYPAMVTQPTEAAELLKSLATSYLYRDALEYQHIRYPDVLQRLVQALALQIGQEVSYNELASTLGIEKATVQRYIRLLEQAFVVFRLTPFTRHARQELRRRRKVYFYDVGIRNAVINNLNPLHLRQDVGALWENWLVAERLKYNQNHGRTVQSYFWRTKQGQELDYIEVAGEGINAYEFKWRDRPYRVPIAWERAYPGSPVQVITRERLHDFLTS